MHRKTLRSVDITLLNRIGLGPAWRFFTRTGGEELGGVFALEVGAQGSLGQVRVRGELVGLVH